MMEANLQELIEKIRDALARADRDDHHLVAVHLSSALHVAEAAIRVRRT